MSELMPLTRLCPLVALLAAVSLACSAEPTSSAGEAGRSNVDLAAGAAGAAGSSASVAGGGQGGGLASGGSNANAGSGAGGSAAAGASSGGSGGAPADPGDPVGPPGSGSLSCNGSSVGVVIPSSAELEILGDWTLELWFSDDEAWCHTWRFLVRKGDEFNDPYFIATEDCGVRLGQKSNWDYFTELENLQADGYSPGWLHIAATHKASEQLGQIYINGVAKFDSELPMTGTPTALGKEVTLCNSFTGKLDDVRIWNVIRTPEQISANYQGQLTSSPEGLVANWTFDDDAGSKVVHDVTGHGHDGALQSGASFSSDIHP